MALGFSARALASIALAAPKAILVASAVLPMPGRPARMIRSEGCRPPMCLFRSRRPVSRPETEPWFLNAFAAMSIASVSASLKVRPALAAAFGGEVEQGLLGGLDLRRAVQLRVGAEGAVDQ